MVGFEPRMPGKERQIQRRHSAPLAVALPPLHKLIPEPSRGPVLDGPGRCRGNAVVLVRIQARELVAEEKRVGRTVAAFAELLEGEVELAGHASQQLEVRGSEVKRAAFDA